MLYVDDPLQKKSEEKLEKLVKTNSDVNAAAIISIEGLPITSVVSEEVEEYKISAMTATLYTLAKRAIKDMHLGNFDQLTVKGSNGYLLISQGGPDEVLLVSTTKNVKLGLVLYDCEKICEEIGNINIISEKIVADFNLIMKGNNINVLTLKRTQLSKLFSAKLLRYNSKHTYASLKSIVISQFKKKGINVEYTGDTVKFIKINTEE